MVCVKMIIPGSLFDGPPDIDVAVRWVGGGGALTVKRNFIQDCAMSKGLFSKVISTQWA